MEHPLTSTTIRVRQDPLLQTEENHIFLPSGGTDGDGQMVRLHPIPHRGERRRDRAVPVQCAGTAISADSSAGINGGIPAEPNRLTERINTDPLRVKEP